jgi:triacylglycerol lipase
MSRPQLVLLHGFLGFVKWGPFEYFRGVRGALRKMNIDPITPEVPGAGTIVERAEVLARTLFRTKLPAFALVAHSMGGLDARYLITNLDPDRRVKSLITVATPHSGTPLALWFLESPGPMQACIRYMGKRGLPELTHEARAAMPIPDREDVDYSSYSSCRSPEELPFWLRRYGHVFQEGNDGMVPVSSARWGRFRGVLRADHVELVGWSLALPDARTLRPFDHLPFWTRASVEAIAAAERKMLTKENNGPARG